MNRGRGTFSFVPSEPDEHFRDVVRCVEDARKDLMRARHRLSKFLLRRGVHPPCKAWTWEHERWLAKVSFDEELSRAVFLDYLGAEQSLVQRRRAMIGVLEGAVAQSSHAPVVERLRCFRGIDTLTAAGLCAEVGNFDRFPKPSLLSGFLGVIPREYTSDSNRVQAQITKAGPSNARRLLVEAAQHYRRRPAVGRGLQERQAGQDQRVVQIAWRAQRRLHERWMDLYGRRGKPSGTVAIACARELAAFCWEGRDPGLNQSTDIQGARAAAGALRANQTAAMSPSTGLRVGVVGSPVSLKPGGARFQNASPATNKGLELTSPRI